MGLFVDKYGYAGKVAVLAMISFAARLVCASAIEFGNDEVYYRLYALFPDWSHFDHPGMVGWVIQLFSLNLLWDSELGIRMAAVVIGTVNIFLVYLIGKELSGERTGWYSALLYVSSIYASVICGMFILPDTPQSVFWLASMLFFIRAFFRDGGRRGYDMLLAGIFCGLAFLSKYTSVFLWFGAGLYILFLDRSWFRSRWLYFALLATVLLALPVAVWNIENDFISLTFHSERVVSQHALHPEFFAREIGGEFFYNNPILFVLVLSAVANAMRRNRVLSSARTAYLLMTGLPLILVFWAVSWLRATLPHWSGPGFISVVPLAAAWICSMPSSKAIRWVWTAVIFTGLLLPTALVEIRLGPVRLDNHTAPDEMGKYDFTLDMYGWEQLEEKFADIREKSIADSAALPEDPLFSYRWYPAANLDYYVASPLGMDLFCAGPLKDIHKYKWINELRGGLHDGMSGWFIVPGRDFRDPSVLYSEGSGYSEYVFREIYPVDTVEIIRAGKHVYNFFIYRVENLELRQ